MEGASRNQILKELIHPTTDTDELHDEHELQHPKNNSKAVGQDGSSPIMMQQRHQLSQGYAQHTHGNRTESSRW